MDRHILRHSMTWGLAVVALTVSGCSMFPEALQPQNLQKLNRGPAPSNDPFFSVPAVHHAAYLPTPDAASDSLELHEPQPE